jgi:hypothetical protein
MVGYVRGVLTAPDVLAGIEEDALRRTAELAQANEEGDTDRSREQRVQREIERLTDTVARMGSPRRLPSACTMQRPNAMR